MLWAIKKGGGWFMEYPGEKSTRGFIKVFNGEYKEDRERIIKYLKFHCGTADEERAKERGYEIHEVELRRVRIEEVKP